MLVISTSQTYLAVCGQDPWMSCKTKAGPLAAWKNECGSRWDVWADEYFLLTR